MNFFAVPKGDTDIRMVYDGTKSGLNDRFFAPWFPLPNAEILINTLDDGFWCVDNDYGEMFLNFWLHPDLAQYSGMDFTASYGKHPHTQDLFIEIWNWCPMGHSPSPYATVQQTRRLKPLIFGDRKDPSNVFHWDHVTLNLPGTLEYCPGVMWISKHCKTGVFPADKHDYVDDLRGTASSEEDAWQVGSKIAKTASFYGVQDAAHKHHEQLNGPEHGQEKSVGHIQTVPL
ncbi:hypothetical protein ACA910_013228 [Epithemia clementina (nom. ined.)]